MAKLTLDQLMDQMSDPNVSEKDLAEYFKVDPQSSGAFAPKIVIDTEKVAVPEGPEGAARSAMAINLANGYSRWRRRSRFYDTLSSGYSGPIIVSEGDSWFQYPLVLKDVVDNLMDEYAVFSLGAAGDLLERMANKQEYLKALGDTGASILVLSGGGNDLVAGGDLASHIERFDPRLEPGDYLLRSFQTILDNAFAQYERMFRQVRGAFPHVTILCHGYDFPVPNRGSWLGEPMESMGIQNKTLQKAIAREMLTLFNRGLRRLADTMPHVRYVDCRNIVGDRRWHDELHPNDAGYADVADLFKAEIAQLANVRSGPQIMFSGPFGLTSESEALFDEAVHDSDLPTPLARPALGAGKNGSLSLHVGINLVDPAHYAGWDGALNACENDAVALQALADRQGFETEILLTRDATRDAVTASIERAASELKAGDMFFMSISAHGSQIPDFNRDETHDGDVQKDETLCLYDFQIADDELFLLWSRFAPGVRILMLPDTCHSGTMVRLAPDNFAAMMAASPAELLGAAPAFVPKVRAMPEPIAMRTIEQNFDAYKRAADQYSEIKEAVIANPLKTPVKASVLSISACQDHQQASDGQTFGAFTGAVLDVWNNGAFNGNYRTFHEAVVAAIGRNDQVPNLHQTGMPDPSFAEQTPFTVWENPRSTVLRPASSEPTRPVSAMPIAPVSGLTRLSIAEQLLADEGDENDVPLPGAPATAKRGSPATDWPDYAAFKAFFDALQIQHFGADELLVLGPSHSNPNHPGFGKNTYPPMDVWQNIGNTIHVVDEMRERIGIPVRITNAYRSPAYNEAVGGKPASQHLRFNALDIVVDGMSAADVADFLRDMRDDEEIFKGGIGRYNSFVHVDTRGTNATWPSDFKNMVRGVSSLSGPALVSYRPAPDEDAVRAIEIAPLPKNFPKARKKRSKTRDVGDPLNLLPSFEEQAGRLNAAVNASSIISFVENLTPQQKHDVLMSTQFAQRAANAKFNAVDDRLNWYNVYTQVLGKVGWVIEGLPFEEHTQWQGKLEFDKAAIGILSAIATGNQMAVLESAIETLRGLSASDGRIKLFDFSTSTSVGGNFQIGVAEAAGDVVAMALGAFQYINSDNKKNVLFVSWGSDEMSFWMAAQRINLNSAFYDRVRDLVEDKLFDSARLISEIDIV